jgi:hypothetical protein
MPTAGELFRIWSIRLDSQRKGIGGSWPQHLIDAVEALIQNLESLPQDENINIDADENRDPIAIFIRAKTGEAIGRIDKVS